MWRFRRRSWWMASFLLVGGLWFIGAVHQPIFNKPTSYVLEDEKGTLLDAAVASDGQWRFPAMHEVPEKFKRCLLTFEDKRFYGHPGFDPLALCRAIVQNVRAGKIVSGGSTLSMQVIRLSEKRRRSFLQKALEIVLAARLELSMNKEDILRLYASNAPFGSNVVGLEAASWRYFGRDPSKLSWGEAATLAVLPNSPTLVRPGKHMARLQKKRNRLLAQLRKEGTLDSISCALAVREPIVSGPSVLPQVAPHLLARFRRESVPGQPTYLHSSLNAETQSGVTSILERHRPLLASQGIKNAAVLVVDITTNRVKAYVGNLYHPMDTTLESEIDMIGAWRSPGSTLKPFLYASMMSDGMILPQSIVADIPTNIDGYAPQNFNQDYLGAVPAALALSRSLNIPAVRMLEQYKYERFYDKLKELGFTSFIHPARYYGLSIILGGGETSLWELVSAYTNLARTLNFADAPNPLGAAMAAAPSYKLETSLPVSLPSTTTDKPLDASSIWFTFQAMEEVMRPGEELLWKRFSSAQRIAWKTGTSFGFRDGWAIGLNNRFVVGVWVGNANGEGKAGLTGINTAAPILFDVFHLLPSSSWFKAPLHEMKEIAVCRESGFRAGPYCNHVDKQWAPVSSLKTTRCPYHQMVHLTASGQFQANAQCESIEQLKSASWFVLPPIMEWYYRSSHPDYLPLPPFEKGCLSTAGGERVMAIIYPKENSKIYIPIALDGKRGKAIFSAVHRTLNTKIFWNLDDHFLGATTEFHKISVCPLPGIHTLSLVDKDGNRAETTFQVLDKQKSALE